MSPTVTTREIPVHEQVTLREEHVSVERRPVEQRLEPGELDQSDLLRERNVAVIATGEEAVVAKEARVREEVVVRKTADPPPAASATAAIHHAEPVAGVKSMTDTNGTTSSGLGSTTASTGSSGTAGSGPLTGSTHTPPQHADTLRPAGGSTTVQPTHSEAHSYNEARSTYQPQRTGTEVVVTERRSASRPSRSLVIGSAMAGAIAGGALPFMLAGRKSGGGRIEVDATRKSAGKTGVEVDASRSSDVSANNDHDPSGSRSSSRRRS